MGARLLEKEESGLAQGDGHADGTLAGLAGEKSTFRATGRRLAAAVDWPVVGAMVNAHLENWLAAQPPTVVMTFLPMADECPLEELTTQVSLAKHRWVIPRIWTDGRMTAHPFESDLEQHRFGLRQPVPTAEPIDERDIGVVLVPGVLFDRQGGRLGRGSSYFDRFLVRLPAATVLVGVTAEALVYDRPLPLEPHDVRVWWLATECGVVRCFTSPPAGTAARRSRAS
jgi:5-formyltetrahydrofolate cyclo-ligase